MRQVERSPGGASNGPTARRRTRCAPASLGSGTCTGGPGVARPLGRTLNATGHRWEVELARVALGWHPTASGTPAAPIAPPAPARGFAGLAMVSASAPSAGWSRARRLCPIGSPATSPPTQATEADAVGDVASCARIEGPGPTRPAPPPSGPTQATETDAGPDGLSCRRIERSKDRSDAPRKHQGGGRSARHVQ